MKSTTVHFFTVEGSSRFPFDMLRYDRCWPATEGESITLAQQAADNTGKRIIGLMSTTKPPTEGRWASFGWKVVNSVTRKVSS